MPRARKATLDVSDPEQLRVLESPACLEILNTAGGFEEVSVAELAATLGRSATSLYPHVRRLAAVGLLEPAGERGEGRERLQLYRAPARQVNLVRDPAHPRRLGSLLKAVSANLRMADRELQQALADPQARTQGRGRDTHAVRTKGWLSAAELAELNGLLRRLEELMGEARPGPRRKLVSLTIALARCEERRDLGGA